MTTTAQENAPGKWSTVTTLNSGSTTVELKSLKAIRNSWFPERPKKVCMMSEVERLREKAGKCRQLARLSGDAEIERRLIALAEEFEAKAVRAGAQAKCGSGVLAEVGVPPDERRKLALTSFNKSW
jgi:hypothetical protein